jgi:hypothetical protein
MCSSLFFSQDRNAHAAYPLPPLLLRRQFQTAQRLNHGDWSLAWTQKDDDPALCAAPLDFLKTYGTSSMCCAVPSSKIFGALAYVPCRLSFRYIKLKIPHGDLCMESWKLVPSIFENSSQNVSLCARQKSILHLLLVRRKILSVHMKFEKARHL